MESRLFALDRVSTCVGPPETWPHVVVAVPLAFVTRRKTLSTRLAARAPSASAFACVYTSRLRCDEMKVVSRASVSPSIRADGLMSRPSWESESYTSVVVAVSRPAMPTSAPALYDAASAATPSGSTAPVSSPFVPPATVNVLCRESGSVMLLSLPVVPL